MARTIKTAQSEYAKRQARKQARSLRELKRTTRS